MLCSPDKGVDALLPAICLFCLFKPHPPITLTQTCISSLSIGHQFFWISFVEQELRNQIQVKNVAYKT